MMKRTRTLLVLVPLILATPFVLQARDTADAAALLRTARVTRLRLDPSRRKPQPRQSNEDSRV